MKTVLLLLVITFTICDAGIAGSLGISATQAPSSPSCSVDPSKNATVSGTCRCSQTDSQRNATGQLMTTTLVNIISCYVRSIPLISSILPLPDVVNYILNSQSSGSISSFLSQLDLIVDTLSPTLNYYGIAIPTFRPNQIFLYPGVDSTNKLCQCKAAHAAYFIYNTSTTAGTNDKNAIWEAEQKVNSIYTSSAISSSYIQSRVIQFANGGSTTTAVVLLFTQYSAINQTDNFVSIGSNTADLAPSLQSGTPFYFPASDTSKASECLTNLTTTGKCSIANPVSNTGPAKQTTTSSSSTATTKSATTKLAATPTTPVQRSSGYSSATPNVAITIGTATTTARGTFSSGYPSSSNATNYFRWGYNTTTAPVTISNRTDGYTNSAPNSTNYFSSPYNTTTPSTTVNNTRPVSSTSSNPTNYSGSSYNTTTPTTTIINGMTSSVFLGSVIATTYPGSSNNTTTSTTVSSVNSAVSSTTYSGLSNNTTTSSAAVSSVKTSATSYSSPSYNTATSSTTFRNVTGSSVNSGSITTDFSGWSNKTTTIGSAAGSSVNSGSTTTTYSGSKYNTTTPTTIISHMGNSTSSWQNTTKARISELLEPQFMANVAFITTPVLIGILLLISFCFVGVTLLNRVAAPKKGII